jgi:hypothetical protein
MDKNFNLQKFIISVVIIGIVLVIGIYITDTIGNTIDAPNTAASVSNETIPYINATGYTLALATAEDFASPVITAAWNATDDSPFGVGNISVSATGVVTNATATVWNNGVILSYTYTYTAQTDASTAATNVVSALATGTAWISILVVVGFAVIILTMLTSGLGAAAGKENEVPYH